MQLLYATKTEYTLEEYQKFNRTVQYEVNHLNWTMGIMMALLCLLAYFQEDFIFVALAFLVPVIFPLVLGFQSKKAYQSNRSVQGTTTYSRFYEDHFVTTSSIGISPFQYEDIFQILETRTNFYILLAKNQGIIIIKAGCEPGLMDLLKKQKEESAGRRKKGKQRQEKTHG